MFVQWSFRKWNTFCVKHGIVCSLYSFRNNAGLISYPPNEHQMLSISTAKYGTELWDIHRTICQLQIEIRPNLNCVQCVFSIHDVISVSYETSILVKIILEILLRKGFKIQDKWAFKHNQCLWYFSEIETMNIYFLNFETSSRLLWLTQRDALPCIVTAYIVSCDQKRITPIFVSKC